MAGNITDTYENKLLDASLGAAYTGPTTPLKLALVTANGTDAAAGTEVTGGSYVRQSITFAAAAAGATSNSADVNFTSMPAVTVVGVEIWDSAATPMRIWYGPLAASKALNVGDTFQVPAGSLQVSLD